MCFGLPGNDIAGETFRNDPMGRMRDKIFGRGTSQKITDVVDDVHLSLTKPFSDAIGIDQRDLGVQPGSFFGQTKGNVDISGEKRARAREARLQANRKRHGSVLTDKPKTSSLI